MSRYFYRYHKCYQLFRFVSSSDMLQMGKSKPWPQALEKLTGSQKLDVGALTEYFKPLRDWMVKQRKELGYAAPGWGEDDTSATSAPPTAGVPSLVPVLFNVFALLFVLAAFF